MSIASTFDIMLQFNQRVMKDIQVRALNTSASTNLWIKGPLSRIIGQEVPPLEVKACWNKPSTEICNDDKNDLIELSAEVNGGARQVKTRRILTIDGEVSIKLPVVLDVDANGRPYARLASPNLLRLHMKKLKATYEGSKWPKFLSKFDPEKEATSLRPVLTTQLMGPLASIPLTYMPYSLPITMPLQNGESNGALPITQAQAQLVKASNSVVLGLMLDQTRSAPSVFPTLRFPSRTKSNAALGISTEGFNTLLSYLCKQGRATGNLVHSQWGPISWQWENLAVTLRQGVIQVAGVLWQPGVRTVVHAQLQCFLDKDGCLQSRLLSTNTDIVTAETILASWSSLFKMLLRLRAADKQDRDQRDRERLYQCFNLPGTSLTVETVARGLVIEDGRLILYYRIPKTLKSIQVAEPPAKPVVVISQPIIPQQIAQGVPVATQVEAKIIKNSSPPYDYVWTTDRSPEPGHDHGPKLAVRKIPRQLAVKSGPQKLADVHLKMIDIFGQVSEVQGPAEYHPYSKLEQKGGQATGTPGKYQPPSSPKVNRMRRNIVVLAGGLVALLAGSGAAVALANWLRGNDHSCPSGQINCNGTCVNSDSNHCGSCGNTCGAGQTCVNGTCVCPSGQSPCDGSCVDMSSAPNHCGSCGNTCGTGQTCVNGTCCPTCNGICVDTSSDPNHCGRCGNVCQSNTVCSDGRCQARCSPDQMLCGRSCCPLSQSCCGEACVDTKSDSKNCGSCGNVCPSGTTCVNGTCKCSSGQNCNGVCVDTSSDPNNCGNCGNVCPSGKTCVNGTCCSACNGVCVDTNTDPNNCGRCANACGASKTCVNGTCVCRCSSGQTCCGDVCVNTNSDSSNCGSCGNVCPSGITCMNGTCKCSSGQNCNGVCVDTNTDPNNCGRCANVCPSGITCVNGTCCSACNGVCVDTNTDPNNCGRCANVCPSGITCVNGTCCSACNGVCVDTNTDPNNCGRCANVCPSGITCVNGTCCSACNGVCVDTNTDPNNCGNCGNVCPSGKTCVNGTCCSACNGVCVDTNTDPNNCGRCANICPSGKTCVNGTCVCSSGQNCNGVCVDTNTDPNNCGRCANVCPSGTTCVNGTCVCSSGQNCNGVCVDTDTDPNNCRSCGNVCPSGTTCVNGTCKCSSGQNCNGVCVDTNTDPNNCGRCANACGASKTCVNGACVCQCPSGQTCCGDVCVNITTDPNNCGRCGNVCSSGYYCSRGNCSNEPG